MREFYIEMGQGIVGQGPLSVRTSPLYSCSLICVHNILNPMGSHCGRGGAFHYPQGRMGDPTIRENLKRFLDLAAPSEVVIIHATEDRGMTSTAQDRRALEEFVKHNVECMPDIRDAVGAGMVIDSNGLKAGRLLDIGLSSSIDSVFSVKSRRAGIYTDNGGFALVGTAE